jgi:hypothetical protein
MNRSIASLVIVLAAAALLAGTAVVADCCPFCGGVQLTLSDEMKAADAVVIARLIGQPERPPIDPNKPVELPKEPPKTKFQIVEILKGQDVVGDTKEIELLYFGQDPPETPFLIQGTKVPELAWGTPLVVSDKAVNYVRELVKLGEPGPERLKFFCAYLEDEDGLLARDAYDEFAKAPYADVKAVKDYLDHDKLVAWIGNPDVTTSHRRLYLTLLGITEREAPRPEDIKMLEEIITADADEPKPALDAAIACYLTLKGPDGMPLVEDEFLKNADCPYSDTYAAIMALRFHGNEEQIIPKEALLAGLRHLLDRPDLADLVIPDLARWEDWSAMDRLVTLFKDADDKSSWVRVPVIQYLRACPLPEAAATIDELAKIDPEAVKRANFFVPLGATAKPVPPAKATKEAGDAAAAGAGAAPQGGEEGAGVGPQPVPTDVVPPAVEKPATEKPSPAKKPAVTAPAKPKATTKKPAKAKPSAALPGGFGNSNAGNSGGLAPAPKFVAFIPLVSGLGLFIIMLSILRGGRRFAPQITS